MGWATQCTELSGNKSPIGCDELSIALDGFKQCLWHDQKEYEATRLNIGVAVGLKTDCRRLVPQVTDELTSLERNRGSRDDISLQEVVAFRYGRGNWAVVGRFYT